MKCTLRLTDSKSHHSQLPINFCGGGGGIFALMLLTLSALRAQTPPCSPYVFEIVKTAPNVGAYPSNAGGPSAFHCYYTVRLKTTTGVFPQNWNVFHLAFSGRIKANNFTSRIDQALTESLHTGPGGVFTNPYFQYLDLTALGQGEVVWKVGADTGCEEMDPANAVSIPLPAGATSVDLFTIAVAGVPFDFVTFLDLGGTVCVSGCTGGMPHTYSNTLDITFPKPPTCNPPVTVSFSKINIGAETHILVTLNGLTPGGSVGKMDGVVHIQPEMNGIVDLDLNANIGVNNPFGVLKRKNADGSFDFYFYSTWQGSYQWANSTENIFTIRIDGQYNLSQGGNLVCSLSSGRDVMQGIFGSTTCSLRASQTTIVITGHPACASALTISATRYVGANCQLGAEFTLSFQGGNTLDMDYLNLELFFITDNTANPPTQILAPQLPCPGCWTITTIQPGRYLCSYLNPNSISLSNGVKITIPFTVNQDCINYFVYMAEGIVSGNPDTCALNTQIDLSNWPACDPSVHGRVLFSDGATDLTVPDYMVVLTGQAGYLLQDFDACKTSFTFCPNPARAPFQLRVQTAPWAASNYRCGDCVTGYDMYLINRHILGLQALALPYKLIAADVNRSNIINTSDLVVMRKCLLGLQSNFADNNSPNPAGASSWYYIADTYQFSNDPVQILTDPGWAQAHTVQVPANGQGDYGLFHAVKIGDVNLNCNCLGDPPLADLQPLNRSLETARLRVNASRIERQSGLLRVPVYADAPFDLAALQGGFRFDADALVFRGVAANPEVGITINHFGAAQADAGELRFVWFAEDGQTLLPGQSWLFTLEFELKNDAKAPEGQFCWLSDRILRNLAYPTDGREISAKLQWEPAPGQKPGLELIVAPNPFSASARLYVLSGKEQEGMLYVRDSRGEIQARQNIRLVDGDNALDLQTDLPPGTYFISIETGEAGAIRKVLKF